MQRNLGTETLSDCLPRLREVHGISQKALALAAGMDQSYLAGLESGRRPPPRDKQLLRLANALNASEVETAQLFRARDVSKISRIGMQFGPPQTHALTHLIMIATTMTAAEVGLLDQIAQVLSSFRSNSRCKEASMIP